MTENVESLPWRMETVGGSAGNAVKELADVFRGATTCWLFFCSSRRPRRGLVKKGLAALSARLSADPLPSRALSYLLWREMGCGEGGCSGSLSAVVPGATRCSDERVLGSHVAVLSCLSRRLVSTGPGGTRAGDHMPHAPRICDLWGRLHRAKNALIQMQMCRHRDPCELIG